MSTPTSPIKAASLPPSPLAFQSKIHEAHSRLFYPRGHGASPPLEAKTEHVGYRVISAPPIPPARPPTQTPAPPVTSNSLVTLTSCDGKTLDVNPELWKKIPGLKPMFENNWQRTVGQSHKFLQVLDHFLQTNQLLDLSSEELLEYYSHAHSYFFEEFEKALAVALIPIITMHEETLFNAINYAVQCDYDSLLESCIAAVNSKSTHGYIELSMNADHTVSLLVRRINVLNQQILEMLSTKVSRIEVRNDSYETASRGLLDNHLVFPNGTSVRFFKPPKVEVRRILQKCFPHAKKCYFNEIPSKLEIPRTIEVLVVDSPISQDSIIDLNRYDHLKLYIQNGHSFHIGLKSHPQRLDSQNGYRYQISQPPDTLQVFLAPSKTISFCNFADFITDEILLEILTDGMGKIRPEFQGLEKLDLKNCPISPSVISLLRQLLPDCHIKTLGKHQLAAADSSQDTKKQKASQDST